MTRIRIPLSHVFLLALLGAAGLACGQSKIPARAPATTNVSVDAESPGTPSDAGPAPTPLAEPAATDGGDDSDSGDLETGDAGASDGADDSAAADSAAAIDSAAPVDGPPGTDDLCARFCGVLLTTACRPTAEACQADCAENLAGSCAAPARADFACEARLTAADYTCDARGRIRLNPGKCGDEETKFGDCLLGAAP